MIHLIASDIDGTLLQGGQTRLDPALFDVIERLEQHGIRFAAASGRQYTNLRRLFAPVADKIDYICENGSLVISDGSVLYKQVIDRALGTKILRCMLEMEGCEPLLSGVMQCYVQPKDPAYADHMRYFVGNDVAVVEDLTAVPEPFLKIAAYFPDGATEEYRLRIAQAAGGTMRPVVSGMAWVDLLPQDCDKGTALAVLQRHLHKNREETMAFGDNENDVELLRQAGLSYAMKTGNPCVLRLADRAADDVISELNMLLSELE